MLPGNVLAASCSKWALSNDVRGKIVQEENRCQQRKRQQKRRNTKQCEKYLALRS